MLNEQELGQVFLISLYFEANYMIHFLEGCHGSFFVTLDGVINKLVIASQERLR